MAITRRGALIGAGAAAVVAGVPVVAQAVEPSPDEEAKAKFREVKIQEIKAGLDHMQNRLEALDALLERMAGRVRP